MTDAAGAGAEASVPPPLFRHRAFLLYWLRSGLSSMAAQMATIAIGWQIYALTHSTLALGVVGLVQFFPALLLALPAGHAADRYSRWRILWLCILVETIAVAGLCLGAVAGNANPVPVYLMAALIGAARAFEWPAASAFLAGIVPRETYPRAIAANSSIRQTATIVGPAIGGLLYGLGPAAAYGACTASFGLALLAVLLIPEPPKLASAASVSLRTIFAGLGFIRAHKTILGAISLDLFAVLLGGATALLPVYARDILFTGPWGLGLLRGAPAVGALTVATILARWPLQRRNGVAMFIGVALFGVATCVFAVSTSFALSLFCLVLMGGGDMVSVYVRLTLVQLRTPDEMRGRVSSVNNIFIGTSNQLGEFESGVTASLMGTVPAVLAGGIGTLAVVGLWAWLFPGLRRIDRLDEAV